MSAGGEAEGSVPAADTSAAYLVKRLCARRGFALGTVPEAQRLADASDYILTRSDGLAFQIVCVIDRERDPGRRFRLSVDDLVNIGKACLAYSGRVNLTRLPVAIQVWDVGPRVALRNDLSRRLPGREKVMVSSWAVDTDRRRVTSTIKGAGVMAGRRMLEEALREPRLSDAELGADLGDFNDAEDDRADRHEGGLDPTPRRGLRRVAIAPVGSPTVVYGLMALLGVAFAAELILGLRPRTGLLRPDVTTLVGLGGLVGTSVQQGEWWRLFTATFLHVDAVHLLASLVALFLGGLTIERLLGRTWMLAVFVVGALAAGWASYFVSPAVVVSVGAAGPLLALMAAALVSTFRLPGAQRRRLQLPLLGVLLPLLIPLVVQRPTASYELGGHLGGLGAGALLGLVLMYRWPSWQPLPGGRRTAGLVTAGGGVLLLGSLFLLFEDHDKYVQAAELAASQALLVPPDEIAAANYGDISELARDLVARFPHDPRARLHNATRLDREGNTAAAEQELVLALAEGDILRDHFSDRALESELRAYLAELLVGEGKTTEARAALAPVCHAGPDGLMPEPVAKIGLCR
jgi:rhomboid protease GluP